MSMLKCKKVFQGFFFFKCCFCFFYRLVERLLSETDLKVVVFNGQLDLIVSTPGKSYQAPPPPSP